MSEGLKFVEENFGKEARPRTAWHIDPFGHSSEQAALFAKMGYDGFFFARIDYQDKEMRQQEKRLEMIWRGSPNNLGKESDIFTGVLYYHYSPPPGMCFDISCEDDLVVDNEALFTYNLEYKLQQFIEDAKNQNQYYRTKNVMFTMGSDFQWEDAHIWYDSLDKIIDNLNKKYPDQFHLFYSTPTRYIEAVHSANLTWQVKTDDFFPYADCPFCYWTGYFTSRPALKGYVRTMNSFLQTCKHMEVFSDGPPKNATSDKLAKAMGVAQHHDAVSGTEKQHVADDYAMRLHIGEIECRNVVNYSLNKLVDKSGSSQVNWEFCEYVNISVCPASESNSFDVLIYNPLARNQSTVITVPVQSSKVSVFSPTGSTVVYDIVPVSNATKNVRRSRGTAQYNVVFEAMLPPLGFATYFVRPSSSFPRYSGEQPKAASIKNEYYEISFDDTTGHVQSITNMHSTLSVKLDQQFFWYNASTGNINSSQASGAYIFRPNSSNVFPVNSNNNKAKIKVITGNLFQEVQQTFSDFVSQVIRVYKGGNFVEFEYTIGPIPFQDGLGKEVISRFDTDLASNSTWYTDANGREMQERIRDYRKTWKLNNTEPVAGNYYPVNSRIYVQDKSKKTQFTVLTDRSQGGSSLKDGSVELMLHRRLLRDDYRGVGEPLNETGQFGDGLIIRGRHWIVFDTIANSSAAHRLLGEKLLLRPAVAFNRDSGSPKDYLTKYNVMYSAVSRELPANVHLLTLQFVDANTVILRLEHQFEKNEDSTLSKPVTVSLDGLFKPFKIESMTELVLGANDELSNVHRLQWKTAEEEAPVTQEEKRDDLKANSVTLNPMEIRTFEMKISG